MYRFCRMVLKRLHKMYHTIVLEDCMKRLCGLMLFCVGVGMTWVLILPKSFLLVLVACALMIAGYNLFLCR